MDKLKQFKKEVDNRIVKQDEDNKIQISAKKFFLDTLSHQYSYNFRWLGIPIIQYPQDIVAMQEIIWETQPDLIIETGIAHGGSLIFYASILELIGKGEIIGIDIDISRKGKRKS